MMSVPWRNRFYRRRLLSPPKNQPKQKIRRFSGFSHNFLSINGSWCTASAMTICPGYEKFLSRNLFSPFFPIHKCLLGPFIIKYLICHYTTLYITNSLLKTKPFVSVSPAKSEHHQIPKDICAAVGLDSCAP